MSQESLVRVTTISDIQPHPNADLLDLALVDGGYPVITRRDEYRNGDLVVYIPVDTMVPTDGDFAWLDPSGKPHRVRAKRLRGVFSMGLVVPAREGDVVGDVVGDRWGMTKYEVPEESDGLEYDGILDKAPRGIEIPVFDVEGWRKYHREVFSDPDEEVVITEKLHGANARFMVWGDHFYTGSRTQWKSSAGQNTWAHVARDFGIEAVCREIGEGVVIFGEILGVQDLKYGSTGSTPTFRVFDVLDANTRRWWDHEKVVQLPLPHVPVLYQGPLSGADVSVLAEGKSTIADHVREGVVIKPLRNRFSRDLGGRAILKLHGEGYLTRKSK